jgi:AraC family transcriptional activator of tynA and feaB
VTAMPCRVGPFPDIGDGDGSRTATAATAHVDGWRDMLREHFVALDVVDPIPDGPFISQVRSTLLGNLSAAAVSSSPQSCVRTGGLARDGDAYLQVGILARGRAVVEQDGREAALEPGRFVVYETDRPFAWHFLDQWQLLVLTWPRHLVDLDAGESRAATARTLGGDRLGGIIGRTLAETVLRPPEFVDDGRRLAGEIAALVGMVLGGSLIRRLRMAHARLRLSSPHDAHLSVTDIAHACGFVDLPTFSHGFKQEYQESPSTYRRRSAPPLH